MRVWPIIGLALFGLVFACGDGTGLDAPDAEPTLDAEPNLDAATPDAETPDAEVIDAQAPDAGVNDAAPVDAEAPDAGAVACSVNGNPGECIDVALCTGTRASTPGLCPGPAEIQCCSERPAGMCDPNQHPLPNEGLVEQSYDDCPAGMVGIEVYCIDRYEAALVEEISGGGTRGWSPYFNPGSAMVRAVSLAGAVPQGYINETQASAACMRAGKRLCTTSEWLRACQGPNGLTYPYGPTRQPGVCNDARAVHPAVEYFMTTDSWIYSEIDHPCLNQLANGLSRSGDHAGCISADGVFDLMGNLHEWIDDPAGTFRGGFYVDTRINGDGCLYRTTAHDVSHYDYSTGFRCCADR